MLPPFPPTAREIVGRPPLTAIAVIALAMCAPLLALLIGVLA